MSLRDADAIPKDEVIQIVKDILKLRDDMPINEDMFKSGVQFTIGYVLGCIAKETKISIGEIEGTMHDDSF